MYEAKLCDECWEKVQSQPIAPTWQSHGIKYAMRYEELCDRCKAVNDELRKTQENSEC